jgi:guanine deaminase
LFGVFYFNRIMKSQGQEGFMRMAIELSGNNIIQGLGGPFGAVIVKDDMLVACSANRVIQENDPTAHAEISAIRLACKKLGSYDLSGCEIYTSCEPCPMCLGAIYWAGISKIYYANTQADAAGAGFNDSYIYSELACTMDNRKISFVQLLREEALTVFKRWPASDFKKDK